MMTMMHTTVSRFASFNRASNSVRSHTIVRMFLSVCLSVTFRCFIQTDEVTIVRFSASGRTIIVVSGEVKFIWIFTGNHPQQGR